MKIYSTKQINACYIITRGKSYATQVCGHDKPLALNPSLRTPQQPTGTAVKDLRGDSFLDPEPEIPLEETSVQP